MERVLKTKFYGFLRLLPTYARLDDDTLVDFVSIIVIEAMSESHARGRLLQFLCTDCIDEDGNSACSACLQYEQPFLEFDCETEEGFVSALQQAGAEKAEILSKALILDIPVLTYDDNIENVQFYKNTYKEILEGKVETLVFQGQERKYTLEMEEDSEVVEEGQADNLLEDLDEADLADSESLTSAVDSKLTQTEDEEW